MNYFVYILTNKPSGVLYIGVTNDIARRTDEHMHHAAKGFTARYNVDKLVHVEQYDDIELAIRREKQLKRWNRSWKIDLIEQANPSWKDLSDSL